MRLLIGRVSGSRCEEGQRAGSARRSLPAPRANGARRLPPDLDLDGRSLLLLDQPTGRGPSRAGLRWLRLAEADDDGLGLGLTPLEEDPLTGPGLRYCEAALLLAAASDLSFLLAEEAPEPSFDDVVPLIFLLVVASKMSGSSESSTTMALKGSMAGQWQRAEGRRESGAPSVGFFGPSCDSARRLRAASAVASVKRAGVWSAMSGGVHRLDQRERLTPQVGRLLQQPTNRRALPNSLVQHL